MLQGRHYALTGRRRHALFVVTSVLLAGSSVATAFGYSNAAARLEQAATPSFSHTALRSYQTAVDKYYQQHGDLPWPAVPHVVLSKENDTANTNISNSNDSLLIVGDVHGCFDELLELVQTAEQQVGRLRWIVLVGDLCNKGPDSVQVIQHVRTHNNWLAVRGNHDNAALKAALGDRKRRGKARYTWVQDLTDDDVTWMAELPYTITIPKETVAGLQHDVLVVHAGLQPKVPLEQQTAETMTTIRTIEQDVPWASTWPGPARVVFGHDAIRGLQLQHAHATGLDSGCVYGKQLTGLLLPQNKLVSVQAHKEHCPVGGKD